MATPGSNAQTGGQVTAKPVSTFVFEQVSYTVIESRIDIQGHNLTLGGAPVTISGAAGVNHTVSLIASGSIFVIADSTSNQPVSFEPPSASSASVTSSTSSSQATSSVAPITIPTITSDTKSDLSPVPTSGTSNPASTTQGASNSTASTPQSSLHGVSRGATAGIAIGCAAVGALIAAALVFLIFRRRRDKRARALEYSPTEKSPSSYKQAEAISTSLDPSSSSSAFALAERDLPLPLEDAAIGGEMSRLQTLIKNYAQSYYHTSPVVTQNTDPSDLGSNLPIPASRLAGMLADPRTRIAAIRFCLMWIITSRITLDSEDSKSFLPLEVTSLLRLMPDANESNCKWLFINIYRVYYRFPCASNIFSLSHPILDSTPLIPPLMPFSTAVLPPLARPDPPTSLPLLASSTNNNHLAQLPYP